MRLYERPRSLFATRFVGVSSELRGTVAARDGGRVRVDTPQGPVLAEGDLPAGAAAVVSTRPENIAIGAGDGPDRNQIEGRVRRVTFHGSRTRIAVDVGAGADFMVEIGGVFALPSPGDAVVAVLAGVPFFRFRRCEAGGMSSALDEAGSPPSPGFPRAAA